VPPESDDSPPSELLDFDMSLARQRVIETNDSVFDHVETIGLFTLAKDRLTCRELLSPRDFHQNLTLGCVKTEEEITGF
jgi:hypothetical protein